ncbi:hypothetical protein [Streptomyces tritici]|uniref:hypothetical protein n=1 Tax=Streptomyces tritici TaxID=2054410 RepID=UPI003AF02AA9
MVGMYLKYVPRTHELGVRIFGTLHGAAFIIHNLRPAGRRTPVHDCRVRNLGPPHRQAPSDGRGLEPDSSPVTAARRGTRSDTRCTSSPLPWRASAGRDSHRHHTKNREKTGMIIAVTASLPACEPPLPTCRGLRNARLLRPRKGAHGYLAVLDFEDDARIHRLHLVGGVPRCARRSRRLARRRPPRHGPRSGHAGLTVLVPRASEWLARPSRAGMTQTGAC